MKGQSEILVFVLLFLLSVGLFTVAVFWGKDIFQRNIDMTKVSAAEEFVKEIDYAIQSLIKFGGYWEDDYKVNGPITLVDSNTIEVRTVVPSGMSIPDYWVNISSDSSYIREMLDGDVFRIQLVYPKSYDSGIKCLTGYNISQGGNSGNTYPYSDNCGGPYSGVFFVYGGDTSFIVFNTTRIPQEGDYKLFFDYNRGDPGDFYENFSVECGNKIYNFPDYGESKNWRWESVVCQFNQGFNEFKFISKGSESVWFDSFRISAINVLDINFFTEGPTLAKPKKVRIEKNSTSIENDKATIKIRITFI